jgi:hypothetical protein
MNKASVKVTHLGIDYAYVTIHISTSKGGHTIEEIVVPLSVGEALADAGATEGEEFENE